MTTPRQITLERFREILSRPEAFLVGAAVGAGITANAAERGGADMLLALNAGRFRMMGASSLAAMLPLRDSNKLVADFARNEILKHTSLPTFFGASCYGSDQDAKKVVQNVRDQGYPGLCNFPTSTHYSEEFQSVLNREGLGFDRELKLVRLAQELNMCGIMFVGSLQQAREAAQAGVDVICMNFGWNTGGTSGVVTAMSLNDVAARAHEYVKTVRSWNPDIICVLEGGPIENAEDLFEICRHAKIDGYIGGSTIELIPMEYSVSEATTEFKMTRILRGRIENLEKRLSNYQLNNDLIGSSSQMTNILKRAAEYATDKDVVLISGEHGSGRTALAESIARQYHSENEPETYTFDFKGSTVEQRAMIELFGVTQNRSHIAKTKLGLVESLSSSALIIENLDLASSRIQGRLIDLIMTGNYKRVYGRKKRLSNVKIILTSDRPFGEVIKSGRIKSAFAGLINKRSLTIPPLKERIGDIPLLVEHFSEVNNEAFGMAPLLLSASATRELMTYDWPGHIVELEKVIKKLQATHAFGKVDVAEVNSVLNQDQNAIAMVISNSNDERTWIMQALRRNGYKRSKTAAELGVSRKTLYNKIKQYSILG